MRTCLPLLALLLACGGAVMPLDADDAAADAGTVVTDAGSSPTPEADVATEAAPPQPPPNTLLVEPLATPWDLVLDATYMYWVGDDGILARCPKTGCGAREILYDSMTPSSGALAIDATNLYWSNFLAGTVSSCAIANCAATVTTLATEQTSVSGLAVSPTDVYWTRIEGSIHSCAIGGCDLAPTLVGWGMFEARGISVSSADVIWAVEYSGAAHLEACPLAGCTDTSDYLGTIDLTGALQEAPDFTATDATNVYWAASQYGCGIFSCPLSGCGSSGPVQLGVLPLYDGKIVLDDANVYAAAWTEVVRCAKTGCSGGPTLMGVGSEVRAVAVDDAYLYWTASTGIYRTALF